MSLATGKKFDAFNWTELPIDDYVINRFAETARSDNQPITNNGNPIFEWAPAVPKLNDY